MLELRSVAKQYDGHWLFKDLSLTIDRGSSSVLLGQSGVGKSTLLKIACQLIQPDEGSVNLETAEVGMLFQRNALFDSLTVEQNLLFPLKERRAITGTRARAIAAEWLERVGLSKTQALMPSELSGGMQKRLGIARALIVEPEFICYDDPTAGLDPITARAIAELIHRLQKENQSTLLCVTNDIQRAKQLGNPIFLLAQGTLIMAGGPQTLDSTTDPRVRQFIKGLQQGPLTEAKL